MLYSLLTKNEIEKIKAILDSENIIYEVLINEELIENQNEEMKYVLNRHGDIRRTDAVYNLIIESEEFSRISQEKQKQLERYNIFPEISDIPFEASSHEIDLRLPMKKKRTKGEKFLSLLALLMLGFFAYNWIDTFVIRIFPSETEFSIGDPDRIFQGSLFTK